MSEIQHQRIKSVYGELAGLYKGVLHEVPNNLFPWAIADQLNAAISELNQVSNSNYDRFKLERQPGLNPDLVSASVARAKISAIVMKLELEYGVNSQASASSALVVTVQQNQTVNVSVIPIQQLINGTDDEELKIQLNSLRDAVETHKDPVKTRSILKTLMDKSWELFIKVLPYVLEHMGS